jgi:hypothetical protein
MNPFCQAIINYEHPDRPDGGRWIRTSSIMWARLLLAPSRIIFADGTRQEFPAAQLASVELGTVDIPAGPDKKPTGNTLQCVVFNVQSSQPNLRIRIRAYHNHDGSEFGHPGRMVHECPNTREWDRAYKKLIDAMNALKRKGDA